MDWFVSSKDQTFAAVSQLLISWPSQTKEKLYEVTWFLLLERGYFECPECFVQGMDAKFTGHIYGIFYVIVVHR